VCRAAVLVNRRQGHCKVIVDAKSPHAKIAKDAKDVKKAFSFCGLCALGDLCVRSAFDFAMALLLQVRALDSFTVPPDTQSRRIYRAKTQCASTF